MNRAALRATHLHVPKEDVITEFADIFADSPTSSVYILGSATMLLVLAMSMLAMGQDRAATAAA